MNIIKEQRKARENRRKFAKENKEHKESPQTLDTESNETPILWGAENSKYKSKEIVSNWAKYDLPKDSYEEIEDQQNIGADYEKITQIPLSSGGHFQFKHEKSWVDNKEQSAYDYYFEIDMDRLAIGLCSLPFFERNNIDKEIFNDTDLLSMENRSAKYKQKYYNDKRFISPETDVQNKIIKSLLTVSLSKEDVDTATSNLETLVNHDTSLSKNFIGDTSISTVATENNTDCNMFENQVAKSKEIIETNSEPNKPETPITCEEQKSTDCTNSNQLLTSPEELEKWLDDFLED